MRVVLLAPRHVPWHSMEEILPSIERLWKDAARGRFRLEILRVGDRPDIRDLGPLLKADLAVASFLSPAVFWTLWVLRDKLRSRIPFFLHTHGEGTVGLARVRELANVLSPQDVFLCGSRAEAASIKVCFTKARTAVCPFPIVIPAKAGIQTKVGRLGPGLRRGDDRTTHRLTYSGRISEQKNLHTLLVALSILRDRDPELRWTLDVFGKPDGWGSPNMGFRMKDYAGYLRRLCHELGLGAHVRWHGFIPRARLDRELARKPHLFVSASLHSDEDFGVAALKSLSSGHPAVLSSWGGHLDLARRFPGRVRLVGAYRSPIGPFVDAAELANALRSALKNRTKAGHSSCRRKPASRTESILGPGLRRGDGATSGQQNDLNTQARELARLVRNARPAGARLALSRVADRLWRRAGKLRPPSPGTGFERRRYPERVFIDYRDPLAQPFFAAYGAKARRATGRGRSAHPLPWLRSAKSQFIVNDPHRGPLTIGLRSADRRFLFDCGLAYLK